MRIITVTFLLVLMHSVLLFSKDEGKIVGVVMSEDGFSIKGARIEILGTGQYTLTDLLGQYKLEVVPGTYRIKISFSGYQDHYKDVTVDPGETVQVNFRLAAMEFGSPSVAMLSDRAAIGSTPVSLTDFESEGLIMNSGQRDLPMMFNGTAGIYASETGGGRGDSRIAIRGSGQFDIGLLINGIPVNDMETGSFNWYSWQSLEDIASSVQVQLGSGNGMLTGDYAGGMINVITDPAQTDPGISARQEYGFGNALKTVLTGNTGRLGSFAFTAAFVRNTGDGPADQLHYENWSYYIGAAWDINENHRLDLFILGNRQEHSQRKSLVNPALYSHDFAKDNGATNAFLDTTALYGMDYNPNWGYINNPGDNYYWGKSRKPLYNDRLDENASYSQQPLINLDWNFTMNGDLSLTNMFYFSPGSEGSSEFYGNGIIPVTARGLVDFQSIYNENSSTIDSNFSNSLYKSSKILANNVYEYNLYGWIAALEYKYNKELTLKGGFDLRYQESKHFGQVRNLLGGDYFGITQFQGLASNMMKFPGDTILNYSELYIARYGAFINAKLNNDNYSGFLNLAVTGTEYKGKEHFAITNYQKAKDHFTGFSVKGGLLYHLSSIFGTYFNAGYYDKAPDLQEAFLNLRYQRPPTNNEGSAWAELGVLYKDGPLRASLKGYYTGWFNRPLYKDLPLNFNDDLYNYPGIDTRQMGAEFEFGYMPNEMLFFSGFASAGSREWSGKSMSRKLIYNDMSIIILNDIKQGTTPQVSLGISASVSLYKGILITLEYNHYMDYYSQISTGLRTDTYYFHHFTSQPWVLPSFGVFNAGMRMPVSLGLPFKTVLYGNVFNIFNSIYIADGVEGETEDIMTSGAYMGIQRRWNAGIELKLE